MRLPSSTSTSGSSSRSGAAARDSSRPSPRPLVVSQWPCILRAREGVADHFFLAHARERIAARRRAAAPATGVLPRDVLAEGELDAGHAPGTSSAGCAPAYLSLTAFCPPIVFADPCSRLIVVTPPASSR